MAYDKALTPVVTKILSNFRKEYELHDLGEVSDFLGMQITRSRPERKMILSQPRFISALLSKAGMADCATVDTPVALGAKFTKQDCPAVNEREVDQVAWYRSQVASCNYLACWTRPDISFAVSKLAKFMANPGQVHVTALKRLLRYLKGTESRGLLYTFAQLPPKKGVYGYYDASHADDVDTRRSTLAYLFFYEGALLSWSCRLHSFITTSTNHSELVASAKAAREAMWWKTIFTGLRMSSLASPIALFSDSAGAIAINYNPVHHEANKHVDLAAFFAREQVQRGFISITHVNTNNMLADALTKPLSKAKLEGLIFMFMCR